MGAPMEYFHFVDLSSQVAILQTTWPTGYTGHDLVSFDIKCGTADKTVWKASLPKEIITMTRPAGVEENIFASLTFAAFTGNREGLVTDDDVPFLSAVLSDDQETLTIYWKLRQKMGFQLILGSVKLSKTEGNGRDLYDRLIDSYNRISRNKSTMAKDLADLRRAYDSATKTIEQLEKDQDDWKEKVFIRFKDVLNAKKRKIKSLMIAAEGGQRTPSRKKPRTIDQSERSSESDNNEDTDLTDIE